MGFVVRLDRKGSSSLPFVAFSSLFGIALLASGCAELANDGLAQDVAQLRRDVNGLMLSTHRGRGESETVLSQMERRSREQASENSRQMSALSARVDTLAAELSRVSARLDEVSQRLENVSRQGASRDAPSQGSISSPPPVTPAPAPPRQPAGGPIGEESYQVAYLDFSKGNYPLAISGFRDFLRRFPSSPLADSAQYWVGEAYFSLARNQGQGERATRALEQAVQEFRKVVVTYPNGTKVPTALYKEALALVELKQMGLAQARLQYLLDHFPQSEEAPLARERLAALKE